MSLKYHGPLGSCCRHGRGEEDRVSGWHTPEASLRDRGACFGVFVPLVVSSLGFRVWGLGFRVVFFGFGFRA